MKTEQGIIKIIIILVIGLLLLSYYGFDLRKTVEAPTTQSNFSYITTAVVHIWHTYLETPAKYLWNNIFLKLIWEPAIRNLMHINNNEPGDLQQSAPQLPQPSSV